MTAKLAPVALFTYKRLDHTKATLEALVRNTLAAQTDLFVFSDGPRREDEAEAVAAVRDLVRSVSGFASITLVERPKNMGLARSVITGVTELLEKHERVIVLEDDLLTSRNFLAYMNDALDHYQEDPAAFSVTGHTFPEAYLSIPNDYPFDTYAGYRCSSWSWGTWRDRWRVIDWSMSYFPAFCQDHAAQNAFNRGGSDMSTMLRLQHEGRIDSWAIRFCYAHHSTGRRCIYPVRTLVKNIGLDNSGTHSRPDPRFFHRELDENWRPRLFCRAELVDERVASNFRAVFDPPAPSVARAFLSKVRSVARRLVLRLWSIGSRIKRLLYRPRQTVDVLVVNTYQKNGGAARAAWRAYSGIRNVYPNAAYLSLFRQDGGCDVVGLNSASVRGAIAQRLVRLDQAPLRAYPARPRTFFSPAIHANPLRIPLSRFRPKLVHLHWVGHGMLRVEEIGKLGCPVVWTLHDTWAFTGGCHYTGDCVGYQQQCGKCPQLASDDASDLSHSLIRRKAQAFRGLDLTIVTPSHWLAKLAASSSLFAGRRIEVIPNGLDVDAFKPIERNSARDYFGVADGNPVILFGAHWLPDPRKGGDLLCSALSMLGRSCTLLTFGEGQLPLLEGGGIRVRALGNLSDNASLVLAYSAADLFVCPSREDNLPNTVAEAMACGTPCVAFDANGLPDMVTHQVDGWLAKAFDPEDLARGIRWILSHPQPEVLRNAARAKAVAEYSLDVMSARYAALYSELTGGLHQ